MPVSTGPSTSTPAPVTSHVEVIQKPRTLVLCFDGMADPRQYNASVTNVFKLYSLLAKDKVADQLCYYQVSAPHFTACNASYVFVGRNGNIL